MASGETSARRRSLFKHAIDDCETFVSRARQTALFLVLALGGAYALGAFWLTHPQLRWLSQFYMWMPGVAGLIVQGLQRQPPRTMGFRFTGAGPWLAALFLPWVTIAACVIVAYALQAIAGGDIIHWQAAAMKFRLFGHDFSGFAPLPLLFWLLLSMLPSLLLALAYRYQLPERLGPGRHVARAALWAGVFWLKPGAWWVPPGAIGEELGWRGWLVRSWRDRPLTALALGAAAWAAFHIPIVVMQPPLHAPVAALSFLLSIASAAAIFQALYLWSGSIWPSIIMHVSWNVWNPFFLGNQYGPGMSIFGGKLWLINGEGLLGMLINGAITLILVRRWQATTAAPAPAPLPSAA